MALHRRTVWLSVCQELDFRFFLSSVLAFIVLQLAVPAVTYRAAWCQMQAYTALALLCVAIVLRERERRDQIELVVKPIDSVYCAECRRDDALSIIVGRRAHTAGSDSAYERLFAPSVRCSLMVALWLAWLAYGALFHEGLHEHAIDSVVRAAIGFSSYVPEALRTARALVYFAMALVSLLAPQSAPVHLALAALLLPFPTRTATPQALSFVSLAARTSLFVALFVVADLFEQVTAHCRWLRQHDPERSMTLAACEMAAGRARRVRLKRSGGVDSGSASAGDVRIDMEHAMQPSEVYGRRYSAHAAVRYFLVALRSAWLLVVSHRFMALGALQLALMLVMIARERLVLRRAIENKKLDGVCISGVGEQSQSAQQTKPADAVLPVTTEQSCRSTRASRRQKPSPVASPAAKERSATARSGTPERRSTPSPPSSDKENARGRSPSPAAPAPTPPASVSVPVQAAPVKSPKQQLNETMARYQKRPPRRRPPPLSECFSPSGASAFAFAPSTSASSLRTGPRKQD